MTGSRLRPAFFVGLFLALLAVALQGVQSEEELEVPPEDLCRPYIEKALKDLGTGSLEQTSAEVGTDADKESHEDAEKPASEEGGEPTADVSKEDLAAEGEPESVEAASAPESAEQAEDEAGKSAEADQSAEAAAEASAEADGDGSEQKSGEAGTEEDKDESPEKADEAADSGQEQSAEEADVKSGEEAEDAKSEEAQTEEEKSAEQQEEEEDGKTEETQTEEEKSGEAAEADEGKSDEEGRAEDDQSNEEAEAQGESAEAKPDEEKSDEATTGEVKSEEATSAEEAASADEAEGASKEEAEEASKEEAEEGASKEEAEGASAEAASGEESKADETAESQEQPASEEEAKDSKEGEGEGESADQTESGEAQAESAEAQTEEAKESEEEAKEESAEGEAAKSEEDAASEAAAKSEEEEEAKSAEEEGKSEAAESAEEAKSEEEGAEATKSRARREVGEEGDAESAEAEAEGSEEAAKSEEEPTPEEDLIKEIVVPENLRPRDHINQLLKLDEENEEKERAIDRNSDSVLKELKRVYDNAIQPLESLYKYRDLSNRHFGDPEIFSKPLVLFMGPWSGGKSSIINYLADIEYKQTSLRTGGLRECLERQCKKGNGNDTGAEPSPAYFNIVMHGEEEEVLDGTQLAADWTFSGLQKFGQGLLDRLKGLRLNSKLLEKVNIVEIPGILEIRKQVQRLFPFNDACQWFIDRADIIFLVYDPSKLDVGPETEAILDQLKGREYQTRIILNKADQVKPEELMRVQGALIWNISPLMSSAEPPIMYSTSLWSIPYEAGAPTRLLYAQERAFLRDLRTAIDKRVEHKIASARRFAVRVRNHAKMVDCYLTTYYNHKTFFGNKKEISDKIIENPQDYHIYEGLSTLKNISRYDLPDPDVYRDFFRLNPLYDFPLLSSTCTYFRGCPINRLDVAIAYDLPELVGKYKKSVEQIMHEYETSPPS
nr:sarcalumenin isoform X1 [Nomia melanderi]